MERWVGKVAIVTGASAGIGEAITKSLVTVGINVIALARREEKLKQLAESLKTSKGRVYPVRCDLRKEEDILNAFHYAETKFGGADILVNNAGINFYETITEGTTEHFRAILEVNVLAPTIATREAVKSIHKRDTEGHIININSILGRTTSSLPFPVSLYQASKHALHAMTENVRDEIKQNKDNIKITSIYPGLVRTEIIEASGSKLDIYDRMPHVNSEDIADAVIFALSLSENVQINDLTVTPKHQ